MSETKINPESLQNRSQYFKSLVNTEFSFLGKIVTEEDSKVKQIICFLKLKILILLVN